MRDGEVLPESARGFSETCYAPEDGDFIASHAHVEADKDGYFVSVETDPYEGHAMFTLPVARQVRDALDRAIKFCEERRATRRST